MKKVLLTMVCAIVAILFWGGKVCAQEASPSVTFNVSDDKKTLTILGQGDLTKYSAVSDELKFSTDGCNNVKDNNDIYSQPVGVGAVYSSDKTYYALYPKKLTSLYPNFVNATANFSWNEDKISSLYYTSDYGSTWVKVQSSDNVCLEGDWVSVDGISKEYARYATSAEGNGRILLEDFKNSDYYTVTLSDVSFVADKKQYLYVVSDNKYVKLADDAEYDANATYYSYKSSFDNPLQYDDFGVISVEEMIRMGYLEHPTETLAQILNYKLTNTNTYTSIKFENTDASQPLLINNDIVKAILYPANVNSVLTNLDLGEVVCMDLSSATFNPNGADGTVNLEELTLPLNDSKETPSNMFSFWQNSTLISKIKFIIPEGYQKIGAETFSGLQYLTNVTLPNSLEVIGDKAFFTCTLLAKIVLGENLKTIGKYTFESTGLTELNLPQNLDKIDDGAFYGLKSLQVVKLNEKLRYIGAGAFGRLGEGASEIVQKTLTIPESVRFIGPYAFAERKYSDIYFQGKDAPVCPYGSFKASDGSVRYGTAFTGSDDKVHYCNGGFDLKNKPTDLADDYTDGYLNRENFKNGAFYMTIMHYPVDANEPDKYSDQSRKYETKFNVSSDGEETFAGSSAMYEVGQESEQLTYSYDTNKSTGNAVANNNSGTKVEVGYRDSYVGKDYIWPSLSQFIRAYVNAGLGLKWDGVTKVDTKLSDEDKKVLKEAGYDWEKDPTLSYNAFLGTRKFALSNADMKSSPQYVIDVKGGQWWTLCVPFNMTKKMVDQTFGKGTEVCLFDRVVRQVNRKTKTNRVILYFTQNVYAHKCEPKNADGTWNFSETAAAPDEDDIVIYAHEAYMIHPTKTDDDAVFVVNDYVPVEGNPTPTIVKGKNEYFGESDVPDNVPYRYVGNYLAKSEARNIAEVKIPKFSYVYASAGDEPAKFWFLTDDQMTWKPNKCVVQLERGAGKDDYEEFFDYNATGAKQASFFGEDFMNNSTTGVDDMVIIAGEDADAAVYSLDGVLVNKTGDMTGLPKGIYVKGGKKYVVK